MEGRDTCAGLVRWKGDGEVIRVAQEPRKEADEDIDAEISVSLSKMFAVVAVES